MPVFPPKALHDDVICPSSLPSMLIYMPSAQIVDYQSSEVYWHPWSVLKILGCRPLFNAISSACRHSPTPIFRPILHPSTKRLSQSITTHIFFTELLHDFFYALFFFFHLSLLVICAAALQSQLLCFF